MNKPQTEKMTLVQMIEKEAEKAQARFDQMKGQFLQHAQNSPASAIDAFGTRLPIEERLNEMVQNIGLTVARAEMDEELLLKFLKRSLRSSQSSLLGRIQTNPTRFDPTIQATARYIEIMNDILEDYEN